jgi:glutamine synthetase type III
MQCKNLEKLSDLQDRIIASRDKLSAYLEKVGTITEQYELGLNLAQEGTQIMDDIRSVCHEIELNVDDTLWPLPKYYEMIYSI